MQNVLWPTLENTNILFITFVCSQNRYKILIVAVMLPKNSIFHAIFVDKNALFPFCATIRFHLYQQELSINAKKIKKNLKFRLPTERNTTSQFLELRD